MKYIFLLSALLVSDIASAQPAEWNQLNNDSYISFASSNIRFAQTPVPQLKQQNQWNAVAWRGEKVHTQILVWSNQNIAKLSVAISGLTNKKDNKITAKNITAGFLSYVITDEFAGGCGNRKPQDFDSSLVADVIDPITSKQLIKKSCSQCG